MHSSDAELYEQWVAGDRGAGDRLLRRHIAPIRRFFAYKVTAPSDAEDLVAKTLEVTARRLGVLRADASFGGFLFAVARNVLRDYLKTRARSRTDIDADVLSIADLGPSPSCIVGEREEQRLLLEALRSIPLNYQIVLELSYFEGLSRTEIAELLERPPGTIASQLRLGRNRLDQRLLALAKSPAILESTMTDVRKWALELRMSLDTSRAS